MLSKPFAPVTSWVFDLDNTLYPPSVRLFAEIEDRMTKAVMRVTGLAREAANDLRRSYWESHGTTLSGLMQVHGIDPTPFLQDVHDISLANLAPDPALAERINALPGRKIIHTNGPRHHAERVLEARGLSASFSEIYGIEATGYLPKPDARAFARIAEIARIDPARAAMFEDDPRNLLAPHAMGMRTVLVHARSDAAHIHHQTDDLSAFLAGVT